MKFTYWIIGIIVILIIFWTGYYLLLFTLPVLFFISQFEITRRISRFSPRFGYVIALVLKTTVFGTIIGVIMKFFFVEFYLVPSNSMQQTLVPGDVVVVDKFSYGPLIPNKWDQQSFLNIFLSKIPNIGRRRLRGTSSINRNDIVVFHRGKEGGKSDLLIKRCTGKAGDTISLKSGVLLINDRPLLETPFIRYFFQFSEDTLALLRFMEKRDYKRGMDFDLYSFSSSVNTINCSVQIADALRNEGICSNLKVMERSLTPITSDVFYMEHVTGTWNQDNMGPIYLPKKGQVIVLNKLNFLRYSALINRYEGVNLVMNRGRFFLNSKPTASYTFVHDYFFLIGDNRQMSQDSRIFGPIPENLIIGRASVILFNNKYWNRFLKLLR